MRTKKNPTSPSCKSIDAGFPMNAPKGSSASVPALETAQA